MVRWLRWHCPPDTGFEIRALAVWGRARYLSVTEAPHNTDFHTWMGKINVLIKNNNQNICGTGVQRVKDVMMKMLSPLCPAQVKLVTVICLCMVVQAIAHNTPCTHTLGIGLSRVYIVIAAARLTFSCSSSRQHSKATNKFSGNNLTWSDFCAVSESWMPSALGFGLYSAALAHVVMACQETNI